MPQLSALLRLLAFALFWALSLTPAQAASFNLLELYATDGITGTIALADKLGDYSPGTVRFTSDPDNATFASSVSSSELRGKITCNVNICGASGSAGVFKRRAPTGSTTISAITFQTDGTTALDQNFGASYYLVVIGDAATYASAFSTSSSVSTSANATPADIAAQLDSYFAAVTSVSSPTATEGGNLVHTVTLSGPALGSELILFSRVNSSTDNADIGAITFSNGVTLTDGKLSVPQGVTSFTITVATVEDATPESSESYTLSVGGQSGTGTITDNDGLATVSSVSSPSATEGAALAHVVTLSGATAVSQTFTLTLANISTISADYGSLSFSNGVSLSGSTLTVPANVASFTVSIAGAEDLLDEPDETYTLTIGGQSGTGTITDNDVVSYRAIKTAALTDVDSSSGASVGDVVTWTITVTNSGTVALTNLHLSAETMTRADNSSVSSFGPGDFSPASVASLAAGAQTSFTASYTLTSADVDAGGLVNSATVALTPSGASELTEVTDDGDDSDGNTSDDSTSLTLSGSAGLTLVKTATLNDDDGTPGVSAGDTIDYAFTVQNTGSVTLTNITVTDPLVTVAGGPLASLAAGASNSAHFTARYTVTSADVLAGSVSNQATASATTAGGATPSDLSGTAPNNDTATVTFLGSISGGVSNVQGALSGATVRLLDSHGTILQEVTTDSAGRYAFIGLEAGTFCISFAHSAQEAVRASNGNAGGAAAGDEVCGLTIAPGAAPIADVDAVMIDPSGVIYDSVTRQPIAGATVTLMFNNAPVPNSWLAPSGDANGVVTGADGRYAFLLQSPAQSGTYSLQVTASGYQSSTLLPAVATALQPATGLGVEQVVPFATAPARGDDTTHYLAFLMSFPNWSDASTLSKGIIHNHVPLDPTGLSTQLSLTLQAETGGLSTPAALGDTILWRITLRNTGVLPLSALSLTDALATGAVLQSVAGVTDDGILGAGETWVWVGTTTLTLATINNAQIQNLATISATDDWGNPLTLESSAAGNSLVGLGKGSATSVALVGLIETIQPELTEILRDDLEETLGRLSGQFSGFAQQAAKRLEAGPPEGCSETSAPENDFTLSAQEESLQANGALNTETYDCARREWRIESVTASTAQSDGGGTQALLSYSHRVERFASAEHVVGRFWGGYASQNSVDTGTAEGKIAGLGVFAGRYGARKWQEGTVDYYYGGALGRHAFTLAFPRAVTISAQGNYRYAALFAGGALSRGFDLQAMWVTPRLGLDLAWAPSAQVSLTATQGARQQQGGFGLGNSGAWRLFAEAEFSNRLSNGKAPAREISLTPSLACEGAVSSETDCGLGLALAIAGRSTDNRLSWSTELRAEERSLALRIAAARQVALFNGTVALGFGTSFDAEPTAQLSYRGAF